MPAKAPNAAKPCSRDGCQRPRASSHNYCAEHWAEYMRQYKPQHDRTKQAASFREGVQSCARFLRERLGDRAVTGVQAAQLLLRVGQGGVEETPETPEMAQRRAMIESLKRRASA